MFHGPIRRVVRARTNLAGRVRDRAGFSVVELIFVLLIMSVVAAMAMPPIANWVASSRVENAARVLAGDLQEALTLSARQGSPVRIVFDAGNMRVDLTDRRTGAVLRSRLFGEGTEFPVATVTTTGISVDVYPNRAVSEAVSITVSAGAHSTRVDMTSVGFIRVVRL